MLLWSEGRVIAVVYTDRDESIRIISVQNMSSEPIFRNSQTDWQRLDAMSDEEIDLSDCPEVTPEQFAKALVRSGFPSAQNKPASPDH